MSAINEYEGGNSVYQENHGAKKIHEQTEGKNKKKKKRIFYIQINLLFFIINIKYIYA